MENYLSKLKPCLEGCYIVGGLVRDKLFNVERKTVDIDLVTKNPHNTAECLKKLLRHDYFSFRNKKEVFSFVIGKKFSVDVASMYGKNIEEDLSKRDFSINAMALDPREPGKLIDPFNGLKDIKNRILKPLDESLRVDPVRILRGIRLRALLDLSYSKKFLTDAGNACNKLSSSKIERVKAEIVKTLELKNSYVAFMDLYRLNCLYRVFPELRDTENVPASGLHEYKLPIHLLKTVEKLEVKVIPYFRDINTFKFFDGFSAIEALKLTALFHDVAKPLTMRKISGKLTFYGHDIMGAKIAQKAFLRLGLGKRAGHFAYVVIKNHMRPFFLFKLFNKGELSERAMYKFFRDTKPFYIYVILLSIADYMATSQEMERKVGIYMKFLIKTLIPFCERAASTKPLLTGRDIAKIKGIEASNCIGIAKEKLIEAQLIGIVGSVNDAVRFVKGVNC